MTLFEDLRQAINEAREEEKAKLRGKFDVVSSFDDSARVLPGTILRESTPKIDAVLDKLTPEEIDTRSVGYRILLSELASFGDVKAEEKLAEYRAYKSS